MDLEGKIVIIRCDNQIHFIVPITKSIHKRDTRTVGLDDQVHLILELPGRSRTEERELIQKTVEYGKV